MPLSIGFALYQSAAPSRFDLRASTLATDLSSCEAVLTVWCLHHAWLDGELAHRTIA
jgi:hypothetical protein